MLDNPVRIQSSAFRVATNSTGVFKVSNWVSVDFGLKYANSFRVPTMSVTSSISSAWLVVEWRAISGSVPNRPVRPSSGEDGTDYGS